MFLEYPADKTCWFLDQQYMLGTDILVAPVFGESSVDYYVPEGIFTNILNGSEVTGPAWVSESHSMSSLPVLLRPESALVIGKLGHTVLDNILTRGCTIIVSRRIHKPLHIATSLRSDATIITDITPIFAESDLVGYDIAVSGQKISFEVLLIGDGVGLDQTKVQTSGSNVEPCQIRWQ
jgi:hypothetical protein